MPNIRYVCNKVGINPSTFYRWMSKHHAFYQLVTGALEIGRDRMNDAAEGVIISGIQRNELKSATYWLSHNSPRYSNREQTEYLRQKNESSLKILKEPMPHNEEATFQKFFKAYETMQEVFGKKKGSERMDKLVKVFCDGDPDLEKIFYSAYSEWKTEKDEMERRENQEMNDPLPPDGTP